MPTRQERFLRLIEAAERFVERDRKLRVHIAHTCSAVAAGTITPEAGIHDIGIQLRIWPEYDPAEKIVATERLWYDLTHRRNVQEARRLAAKRVVRQRKTSFDNIAETYNPDPTIIQRNIDQDNEDYRAIEEFILDGGPSKDDVATEAAWNALPEEERKILEEWSEQRRKSRE